MDGLISSPMDGYKPPAPGERLTAEELRTLAVLMARYCYYDLDQWDDWRIGDGLNDVYVRVQRGIFPDTRREDYGTLWPPGEPDSARFWTS